MSDLTDRLDAIQAQLAAATSGELVVATEPQFGQFAVVNKRRVEDVDGGVEEHLANLMSTYNGTPVVSIADAEFIAAAPENTWFLLVLARKQQAAIDAGLTHMENRAQTLRLTADRLMKQVLDRDPERDHDATIRYEHYALEAASGVAQLRQALEGQMRVTHV
jgi:hypothetical protein